MKQSIFVSAPSRASFLLAACLLVPQVVLSERTNDLDRIADLAPGIDRVVDAVSFVSRRSLQMDSAFVDFMGIDDEESLNFLATVGIDEDLEQCMVDTEEFYAGLQAQGLTLDGLDFNPEEIAESFGSEESMEMDWNLDFANNKIEISIVLNELFTEQMKEVCDITGGYLSIGGGVNCSGSDPESGMDTVFVMSGFSMCVADTPSCRNGPNPLEEMVRLGIANDGAECVSTKPATLPEAEPETLPEPEPEILPEPEPETLPEPEPETLPEPEPETLPEPEPETLPEPEPETLPEPEPETLPEPEPETLPEPEPETLPEPEPETLPEPEPETLLEPEPVTSTGAEDDSESKATDEGTSAAMDSGAGTGFLGRSTGYMALSGILVVATTINFV